VGVPGLLGQRPAVLLRQRRQQPDRHLPQQLPRLGPGEHPGHPVQPPGQLPRPGLDLPSDLLRHIVKDHTSGNPAPSRQIPRSAAVVPGRDWPAGAGGSGSLV
jgi:hypothetical protein